MSVKRIIELTKDFSFEELDTITIDEAIDTLYEIVKGNRKQELALGRLVIIGTEYQRPVYDSQGNMIGTRTRRF